MFPLPKIINIFDKIKNSSCLFYDASLYFISPHWYNVSRKVTNKNEQQKNVSKQLQVFLIKFHDLQLYLKKVLWLHDKNFWGKKYERWGFLTMCLGWLFLYKFLRFAAFKCLVPIKLCTYCSNSHAFTATVSVFLLHGVKAKESQNTWGYHFLKWQKITKRIRTRNMHLSFFICNIFILLVSLQCRILKFLIFFFWYFFGNNTWQLNVAYQVVHDAL